MTKGTPSMGKMDKKTHIRCRRCGRRAFHVQKKRCASCGFGDTARMRGFQWNKRMHK